MSRRSTLALQAWRTVDVTTSNLDRAEDSPYQLPKSKKREAYIWRAVLSRDSATRQGAKGL